MLFCFGIAILLGHAEINNVDDIGSLSTGSANQEVIWLYVAVDEILFMNGLHPRQHLFRNHDDRLDAEPTAAMVKQILERGAQQVDHQDIVKTFLSEIVDIGNAS